MSIPVIAFFNNNGGVGKTSLVYHVSHMLADQDYLRLWTNSRHPGSCTTLAWDWNHCEHWDDGFPRRGARIVHASNFCRGPRPAGSLRLAARLAFARLGRALADAARPARAAT